LWYHDHRIDHTAENTYKGLEGFHLMFNQFDTGNETTGFRLPSYPQFDIPIILNDKLIDPDTGKICFDTFDFKGLLGDIQLANGIIQPYFNVSKRRYRFRVLNGGPSRFYELFLTDPLSPGTVIPFWVVGNDGNLLPKPKQVTSFRISVAERYDIIIDFNQVKNLIGSHTKVRLENRMIQDDGQGPTCDVAYPGQGTYCVEFRIGAAVGDNSVDPATQPSYYTLPTVIAPRITRHFEFDRDNGQWVINERFANCNELRFTVTQNSAENWVLTNPRDDWQHPIHVHLEEHQILKREDNNGRYDSRSGDSSYRDRNGANCPWPGGGAGISTTRPGVPNVEVSRKDVTTLQFDEDATIFFRFRDFRGDWPMHCHNTVHEDHAMMLLFQVQPNVIDNTYEP
jgi:FtsP/CotA-like multicopper oxidase with cupredoxin domain